MKTSVIGGKAGFKVRRKSVTAKAGIHGGTASFKVRRVADDGGSLISMEESKRDKDSSAKL